MLENLSKENFNQLLGRFSTYELENLIQKHPYFHQAHILLAKKYQQENNPKFDEQLQLAALYSQDREFLFSVFQEVTSPASFNLQSTAIKAEQAEKVKQDIVEENLNIPLSAEESAPAIFKQDEEITAVQKHAQETITEETAAKEVHKEPDVSEPESKPDEIKLQQEAAIMPEAVEETGETFVITEPHTFDEWLHAFTQNDTLKLEFHQEPLPEEPEKQDAELEQLIMSNSKLHELVEEEAHYSKGLDVFIEEQKQKHKPQEVRKPKDENEMAPELITETMAKIYEMQKKYPRAIQAYEILALKYPEKSDLFAARINYLKNIT